MTRIPSRPVNEWPKKQLNSYAYDAIVRDTFSEEKDIQAAADQAYTRWRTRQMDREELKQWAGREVEYRMLNS